MIIFLKLSKWFLQLVIFYERLNLILFFSYYKTNIIMKIYWITNYEYLELKTNKKHCYFLTKLLYFLKLYIQK